MLLFLREKLMLLSLNLVHYILLAKIIKTECNLLGFIFDRFHTRFFKNNAKNKANTEHLIKKS